MKPQDDILARDAGRHQLLRDRARRAVILDPHLTITDVDMHNHAVDAADAVPADVEDLVVVPITVHDGLRLDLAVRGLVPSILLDEGPDDLTVAL
jgi:hypothetical protein